MKFLNVPINDLPKKKLDNYAAKSGLKKQKIVELALLFYIKKMDEKK